MRYHDSREHSAELLRQALPLMARQAAALHPISYAVWYAYVAHASAALRAAIDAELEHGGVLDEERTATLYHRHIADVDLDESRQVAQSVESLLDGMSSSAQEARDQTARFESSLTRLDNDLSQGILASLDEALSETRLARASMQALQQRLDECHREIGVLREQVHRATHEALIDGLTGLANRRAFDRELSASVEAWRVGERAGRPCLVIGDVDHFKQINDTHGHSVGDQVLRTLGTMLRQAVAPPAIAARIGGEEFAILVPCSALAEAKRFAEELRASVAASRLRRRNEPAVLGSLTVSFGVTEYHDGETEADFFDRADQALYASKNAGRNRVTAR